MSNGIYAAATGMSAEQTQLDTIANDIANVNTVGFKSERIGFENLLPMAESDGVPVGGGATSIDAGPTSAQGALEASDNPIALGIQGPGFIQVSLPGGGSGLTRDGDLGVDAAGQLVGSSGERLVPPITLPTGTQPSAVTIGTDGTVSVSGRTVGKIQLVDVPASAGLLAAGQGVYQATAASGAARPITGSNLVQGELEQSNVNVAQEMSDMLNTQNAYSMLSRVISTQQQLGQIANEMRQ
jgi:flagellar basal-body rod protein FlgG